MQTLHELRIAANQTRQAGANAAQVSMQTMYNWEKGKFTPPADKEKILRDYYAKAIVINENQVITPADTPAQRMQKQADRIDILKLKVMEQGERLAALELTTGKSLLDRITFVEKYLDEEVRLIIKNADEDHAAITEQEKNIADLKRRAASTCDRANKSDTEMKATVAYITWHLGKIPGYVTREAYDAELTRRAAVQDAQEMAELEAWVREGEAEQRVDARIAAQAADARTAAIAAELHRTAPGLVAENDLI